MGTTTIVLNKVGITVVLNRLARDSSHRARLLYSKLMVSWGHRPDRQRVTLKVGEQDLQVLQNLDLPAYILGSDVVPSGWCVLYRHPRKPTLEVRVRTKEKPPKKRIFRMGGKRVRLVAVEATKIKRASNTNHKEAVMAKAKTKKRKDEEEELDELEGLEDLDDLEDLEDEEEPEDEEDEDEDEEDEEPAPKRSRKKAAAKSKSKTSRSRKAADEDEDEDEEDEDEPPARKKKATAKAKTKKSTAKGKNGRGNLPATRELPKGKIGPQDIAEMVGGDCDARYVRIFLRDSEDYEREEGGRWAFSKTEARQIAKEIKAKRRG